MWVRSSFCGLSADDDSSRGSPLKASFFQRIFIAVMSQRTFARHRGVAISTVQTAIQTGRISTMPDGQIDSEVADEEWACNTRQQVAPPGARRTQQDDNVDS